MATIVKALKSLGHSVLGYRRLCICMEKQNNVIELYFNCVDEEMPRIICKIAGETPTLDILLTIDKKETIVIDAKYRELGDKS